MTPSTLPYEFLVRFDQTGQLAGMHYVTRDVYRDDAGTLLFDRIGVPQPVAAGGDVLAQVLPSLNAAALAQVQDLTARLAAATAAAKTALDDAMAKGATILQREATIKQLQAQLAAAAAPAASTGDALLSRLNATFDAAIPAELRAQFAPVYAIVRALVQADRLDLARAVVDGTAVPDSLADAKAQILAALTASTGTNAPVAP